ncbi:hypothetical protein EJ03DRAFT_36908 [Teratosphaeria nubilosa]|uniref:Uncharacterized protein n=1 Tax=Teratosphaeria nubilosa TaxID=161662 RepID=A0A6G1LF23_9PEZI|nr:hypothetical protein EJ03DRAFT_36908 [Teratosphaeria nubilosa]
MDCLASTVGDEIVMSDLTHIYRQTWHDFPIRDLVTLTKNNAGPRNPGSSSVSDDRPRILLPSDFVISCSTCASSCSMIQMFFHRSERVPARCPRHPRMVTPSFSAMLSNSLCPQRCASNTRTRLWHFLRSLQRRTYTDQTYALSMGRQEGALKAFQIRVPKWRSDLPLYSHFLCSSSHQYVV